MNENESVYLQGDIVEEHVEFTLIELCRITGASSDDLVRWVEEGAFEPQGARLEEWRFSGTCLRRAITAQRLTVDLELNAPGVALALDLLDQIDALRTRLARFGG
ncbi:chaperone modulator CbpM [Paraburkholderia metrosideri]|jgi:chaperone modulatory protein CbpM|uniref:Chaperone modulatory protein CbpM n=1 Tax=Paraburkholderia metrosideri TaxID=580937 RepID=A0ABN7IAT8_9BURK|nr:chaperone modulator CbpM [Paraburkholderia metrosideri]CAD6554079.1 Chaperone modulatory protein CbpM [Paraburkholderia metrosideri]